MVTDEKCKNFIYIFFLYLFWTINLAKLTCQFYMNFLLELLHTHFICKYWRSCFFPIPIYLLSLFIGLAKTFIIVLTRIVESRFLCLFSHLKKEGFQHFIIIVMCAVGFLKMSFIRLWFFLQYQWMLNILSSLSASVKISKLFPP